jgi:hypothetical protein
MLQEALMYKRYAAALVISLTFLALVGCASTRANTKDGEPLNDSVSIAMLTEKDLKQQFGYDFNLNPFIAPNGSILPKKWDFIMARLTIVTKMDARVEIYSTNVVDKDNVTKAWFYDREAFGQYVANAAPNDQSAQQRVRVVNWWVLPSNNFQVKPGKHEYILTFMGKHPVPSDLTAQIQIAINSQEQDFTLPVPEQKS